MEVLVDYLGPTLRELVVDATVVLLVCVQLAQIHRLDYSGASTQERIYASVFDSRDKLPCEWAEVVYCPQLLLFIFILAGFCLFFYLILFNFFFSFFRLRFLYCLNFFDDKDDAHHLLVGKRPRTASEPETIFD